MRDRPTAAITAWRGSIATRLARIAGPVMLVLLASTCRLDKGPGPSAPPTHLEIISCPTTTAAGSSIALAVTVVALDASGKLVPGYTGNVTVALSNNPVGGMLSGTTTVAASGGVATFGDLRINRAGAGYQLQASANGLSAATCAPFDIIPGPASQLVLSGGPSSATAGAIFALQVTVRDGLDNTVVGYTGNVTVAITPGTGTSGATLSGTTTVAAVAGVASFYLSIDKAGTGYSLTFTAANLGSFTSPPFDIAPGPCWQIAIAGDGQTATVGTAVAASPAVICRDQFNNPVAGVAVTFAVASGGGTVSPATVLTDANGIASATWTLGTTAGPNTLVASVGGLTVTFTATGTAGPASSIAGIAGNGQTAIVGTPVVTPPAVFVGDQFNNPVAGVTVTFAVTSGGGSVTGATQTTNAAGIATVGSWTLGTTAGLNTLTATAGTLAGSPVTFSATGTLCSCGGGMAINAGDGQSATVGTAVAVPPAVIVRDQFNNPVAGVAVTFTVASGGGTVSPATPVTTDANGIAAATTWTLGTIAGPNTLTATAGPLSPVTFSATGTACSCGGIAIYAGDGQSATVGTAVAIAPAVVVRDQFNNPVAGVAVTFAVATGGGTVSPATPVTTDANGIAATAWTLGNTVGPNTLTATAGTLAGSPVTFSATATAGAATQLVFSVQPSQATAGAPIVPAVQVTAQDQFGNTAVGFAGDVRMAIGSNPAGGTLCGTTTVAAVAGLATFSSLCIDKAGSGYTLSATGNGLTAAMSTPFAIVAGAGVLLVFTVQPTTTTAGAPITPAVRLTGLDAFGNTVTGFTGNVSVVLWTNPAGGTLSGTTTVAAVAGVATFADLSIDRAGTGYILAASATGLGGAGAASAPFTITTGP